MSKRVGSLGKEGLAQCFQRVVCLQPHAFVSIDVECLLYVGEAIVGQQGVRSFDFKSVFLFFAGRFQHIEPVGHHVVDEFIV